MTGARPARIAGAAGAALKYDLLTALGAAACAGDKHRQRTALRLMTLITARYDWRADSLATGQAEIARLWSVDTRTVKREMARLREREWLWLKVPAAKGRVACYGLGIAAILRDTAFVWPAVGPDFAARLAPEPPASEAGNVVPFAPAVAGRGPWAAICGAFRESEPGAYAAWIAPLRCTGEEDALRLHAPTGFHESYVRSHYLGELARLARRQGIAEVVLGGPDEPRRGG
ncbi:DnaA N-terminal domain-containing protein [uncultured Jannaschia sp.]|uniref:DnaA N-terminal domain-containing protein n=1 Tax=uncultured Jannaschia sp. TaxID=293347 RepID=UPI002633ACC2|nr:DnaA N-terminal domain-containing protein [uncultured Jannaschia sp.]